MADNRTVCIDSCVVISFLKGGTDRIPSDVPILKGLFSDIHQGRINVLFPTILRTELMECNLGSELKKQFEQLTNLDNFDEIVVNSRIAEVASQIRSFYKAENQRTQAVPILAPMDCIFLATAIVENCPVLFTYDGDRQSPSKPRKLLALKGPIAGEYPLDIRKPQSFMDGLHGI
ncbi:MAG: PIN domain-containing protein [Verrucomicrobiota bacterium]